jgi:hypothetical protein
MSVTDLAHGSSKEHWRFRVTMVTDDPKLLGEDERGILVVPVPGKPGLWFATFSPYNPRHWRPWLRSRRTLRLAMVCADPQ